MQRLNAQARGRAMGLRQTTLPYGARPCAPGNTPYRAPLHSARQPLSTRGSSAGARPGILKKPQPQLQHAQGRKTYPLQDWKPTTGQPHASTTTRVQTQVSGFATLANSSSSVSSTYIEKTTAHGSLLSEAQDDATQYRKNEHIITTGPSSAKGTKGVLEVFGVLDSPLTCSHKGLIKHFTLRQERSSVNCIFYQIDRALGTFRRGSWLRCVGLMTKSGQLLVVSVRLATDEEKSSMDGLLILNQM